MRIVTSAHCCGKPSKSHHNFSSAVVLSFLNDRGRGSNNTLALLDEFVNSLLLDPNSSTGIGLTFLALGLFHICTHISTCL